MDIFKKLNYILDKKQKRHIGILAVMIFVGGILETLSVSAMLPVVAVIITPESIMEIEIVRGIMDILDLKDSKGLTIALLLLMIVMYVIKNVYLLFLVNEQTRFITNNRNKLIKSR